MREILFRGKSVVTDRWIEGSLLIDKQGICYMSEYIPENQSKYTIEIDASGNGKNLSRLIGLGFVVVRPATVGQFTGLLDKSGQRIFEGDIVRGAHIGDDLMVEQVEFYAICGWTPFDYLREDLCDVIGNVHDNKELLEGG